jgi:hypothetical protein
MIERMARAILFGIVGTVVGFYAVVFILDGIYSLQHGMIATCGESFL